MLRSATPQQQRAVSQPYSPDSDDSYRNFPGSNNAGNGTLQRKGSFSFLRRSKSRERSVSGSSTPQRKLSKKERFRRRDQEMLKEQIPSRPPKIPTVPHLPDLQTFGGEDERSEAIMSTRANGSFQDRLARKTSQETMGSEMYRGMPIPPVPPIPSIPGMVPINRSPYVDAFPKSESMAHRGRYSYASSAISTINSPRKIRRRKDPTPFNILVIGARSSGKTSFLNFLRTSLAQSAAKQRQHSRVDDDFMHTPSASAGAFPTFTSQYVETGAENERIGVTLWDSEGLKANVVDIQIQKIASFIESKFEDTFNEENQVARAPGFKDSHIHCVFLILDPVRLDANLAASQSASEINGYRARANSFANRRPDLSPSGLDENLDLNVLRGLKGKTTVIPIIAKADTITSGHMSHLKRAVWESLIKNGLETLEAINQEDEDDSDSSSEYGGTSGLDERDEDAANAAKESDDFSVTSVLHSDSDTSSTFSASDFDLAKPGKPAKTVHARTSSSPTVPMSAPAVPPSLPLSIISPDPYEPDIIGRKFPWGFADPMNAEHCDFVKLKQVVFTEWRSDLREASRELWYEGWRTSRLNKKARRDGGVVGDARTQVWAR